MKTSPKSPVTGSDNVIFERNLAASFIIDQYRRELDIDVTDYFYSIGEVSIYKCLDSGYQFYHPFSLAGDDSFYQELEKFPWYYMDWKWEHGIAEKFVNNGQKVLEVGCAKGGFLKKIAKNGVVAEGLEMNSRALAECLKNGLRVYPDSIEKFSAGRKNAYDLVCSFQVMEHVPGVRSFIETSLSALKPGGSLVISVPNNDSLMIKDRDQALNMPPHHMGMWNLNSLLKLPKHFAMDIDEIYLEPLQEYHLAFALKGADKKIFEKLEKKAGPLAPLLEKPAKMISYTSLTAVREWMLGHTILASFKKR